MARIEDGASGNLLAGVDGANRALRVSPKPLEALGHYRLAQTTGLVAGVAAGGELAQFRWTDSGAAAVLQFLRLRAVVTQAFTAGQEFLFEFVAQSGNSAAGAGGTLVQPAATSFKKKLSMPQSRLAEWRLATTAALTAGTRTLSPSPFLVHAGFGQQAGAVVADCALDLADGGAEHPFIFQQNEGFVLRLANGMGAGGSLRVSLELAWAEVNAGGL